MAMHFSNQLALCNFRRFIGGWGNLGGGVTQLVMGSALFPLFKAIYDGNAEKAWRTVSVVPAVVAFATRKLMNGLA
jgi:hypothetical protein